MEKLELLYSEQLDLNRWANRSYVGNRNRNTRNRNSKQGRDPYYSFPTYEKPRPGIVLIYGFHKLGSRIIGIGEE